ncbi:hypothetical protein J3R82DRAFT_1196 [Butyriboletus roseoflavus]|nr:hypothetical protein J3R82DRAFT_1196 [Butyriboletus roseoflavus]
MITHFPVSVYIGNPFQSERPPDDDIQVLYLPFSGLSHLKVVVDGLNVLRATWTYSKRLSQSAGQVHPHTGRLRVTCEWKPSQLDTRVYAALFSRESYSLIPFFQNGPNFFTTWDSTSAPENESGLVRSPCALVIMEYVKYLGSWSHWERKVTSTFPKTFCRLDSSYNTDLYYDGILTFPIEPTVLRHHSANKEAPLAMVHHSV